MVHGHIVVGTWNVQSDKIHTDGACHIMVNMESELVGTLSQSTTKDHIRAEGDFHKEIYSWKDQLGRNKTRRTEWESEELLGEFMEWNRVERAIETEIDTRTEWKGVWASSVGF